MMFPSAKEAKLTLHNLPSRKWQKESVSHYLVNIVEHLAVKEPDTSLTGGGDQNRAKRRLNFELTFIRWQETQLQRNVSVAPNES